MPSPEQWTGGSMDQTYKAIAQKCFDTKSDPHTVLLQIRSTPLGPGLPSPATLLFNHTIKGIMSTINRPPTGVNNSDEHYEALVKKQQYMIRSIILPDIMLLFQ